MIHRRRFKKIAATAATATSAQSSIYMVGGSSSNIKEPVCLVNYTDWRLRCPQPVCSTFLGRCDGLDLMDVSVVAPDLQLIKDRGVGMVGFTRTKTSPSFIMAVAVFAWQDKGVEISEVSYRVSRDGLHEQQYTELWRRQTSDCCREDGGLVLDVGANLGYYALYAATLGCRVVAWEPIPTFGAFVRASAAINGLAHRVEVRRAVASDAGGRNVTMLVPRTGWDISSVGGLNQAGSLHPTWRSVRAPAERLDDVVFPARGQRICALKLDTEGFEPAVVRGAHRLLRASPPRFLLLEYNPGAVERRMHSGLPGATAGPDIDYRDYPRMLHALQRAGIRLWLLAESFKHLTAAASGKLAALRKVDERNVAAELASARHVARVYANGAVAIPWDVHPLSLRASFRYNTDLLGVLSSVDVSGTIATTGRVGMQPNSSVSVGGYECRKLSRATRRMGLCAASQGDIARAAAHVDAGGSLGWHALFPESTPSSWGAQRGGGLACWWLRGCLMQKARPSAGAAPRTPL